MKPAFIFRLLSGLIVAISATVPAYADSDATTPDVRQQAVIDGATHSRSEGNIQVNSTAGAGNAQANLAAVGAGGDSASVSVRSRQTISGRVAAGSEMNSSIGGAAFAGARGRVAVNQASGLGNAQVNAIAVAVGGTSEISIEQLSNVTVDAETKVIPAERNEQGNKQARRAHIADSAFAGAAGIVQVNQAAGIANRTANLFSLSIGTGLQ